jgi:transposase
LLLEKDLRCEQDSTLKESFNPRPLACQIGQKAGCNPNFLIEMGGVVEIYENDEKLIAASGLDPSTYESGKYAGKSRISKRGNRHLRRVIWLMATRVIINNDLFKTYFKKREKDGLPYKKAVLATAHKLIRTIFVMLSRKTYFVEGGIKYS